MDLSKITLAVQPLSGKIMLIRVGKDPTLALEQREAENDVMHVLSQLADRDKGNLEWKFESKDYKYEVLIKRKEVDHE